MNSMRRMMTGVVSLFLLSPLTLRAQGPAIGNPLGDQTLLGFLNTILEAIVLLMIPIIVLMVIYSGFLFVTAQGNEEKLSRAKMTLTWTLVGALIILGANAILDVITGTVDSLSN